MTDTQLTQGAVVVAGLAKRLGASTMARKLSLTEAAIRSHATGVAVPRAGARERYRATYDVPVSAWVTPAGSTLPPPAPVKDAPAAPVPPGVALAPAGAAVDAREAVVDLLRVARAQLEAAQADAEVPYRERAQLITSCTGLCRLLARLSGQLEVTEVAIVRSAAWARAMRVVREVLEKHPAAAAELDAALERFASGGHE